MSDRRLRRERTSALSWLFQQHDALEDDLQWIDRFADDEEVTALRQRDLKGWLERLGARLTEHFAAEERSDLYTTLPERAPHYTDEIARLQVEHGVILRALKEIEIEIERDATSATLRRLDNVILRLRAHEATENRILLEADTTDLGLVD